MGRGELEKQGRGEGGNWERGEEEKEGRGEGERIWEIC